LPVIENLDASDITPFVEARNLFITQPKPLPFLKVSRLLKKVAELLRRVFHYHIFSIMLVDEEDQTLKSRLSVKYNRDAIQKNRIPLGKGLVGSAVTKKKPLRINDVRPIADGGYRSSPASYLRSNERGTHIARLSMKHMFVKPNDFQPGGEIPHLVGIAKLGREVSSSTVRREPEVHSLAGGQEERLTGRREPASPASDH